MNRAHVIRLNPTPEHEFTNLGHAFDTYWRMNAEGTQPKLKHPRKDGEEAGFPHFKSKKQDRKSFYVANDKFSVHGHTLRVPKLGKILSAVISERAGWWFVSISVEVEHETPTHSGGAVGIDLGIKTLARFSDGTVFENQRHYRRSLGRIKGLSKGLSRKIDGSRNWGKNADKLAVTRVSSRSSGNCSISQSQRADTYNWWIAGSLPRIPAMSASGSKKI